MSAPLEIYVNGEARRVSSGQTVAGLLRELGLPPRQVAVEINLELLPRARHEERRLLAGDRLEVVSLVGGG